jgi:hypothetical protein
MNSACFIAEGVKMRNYFILTLIIALILTLAGFISPDASSSEDKTCWFKASGSYDVYFIIREKTAGMADREYVMWEGWVMRRNTTSALPVKFAMIIKRQLMTNLWVIITRSVRVEK